MIRGIIIIFVLSVFFFFLQKPIARKTEKLLLSQDVFFFFLRYKKYFHIFTTRISSCYNIQRWEVTENKYFFTVLQYTFQVSVLSFFSNSPQFNTNIYTFHSIHFKSCYFSSNASEGNHELAIINKTDFNRCISHTAEVVRRRGVTRRKQAEKETRSGKK